MSLLVVGLVASSGAFAAETPARGRWGVPLDATGGVLGSDSQATTSSDEPVRRERQNQKLVIRTRLDQETFIDVGEEGFSDGDYTVFTEHVFNRKGKRQIGVSTAQCTFIGDGNLCQATFTIDGRGDIEVEGTLRFLKANRFLLSVTGGTDNFRRVGGDVELVFPDDPDDPEITFVFQLRR